MPESMNVRVCELLAALSLGTDLTMGHPMEHALRQTFIALWLADRAGLDRQQRQVVHHTSLLAWVGCHVDAYEQAKWFGDDQALKHDIRTVDLGKPLDSAWFVARRIADNRPLAERAWLGLTFLGDGRQAMQDMFGNHWRAAVGLATRLGLDEPVLDSLIQTFERWDGKGEPAGAAGEEVLMPSRLINLADVVEVFYQAGGVAAAVAVARARSGSQFDPALVDLFCHHAPDLFAELAEVTSWEPILAGATIPEPAVEPALAAVADFADLKSPYTIGHSRGVAELAAAAADGLGLPGPEVAQVRQAALIHDLGRLGVSNAIWDKPRRLTPAETERVRLHPYLTERMLSVAPALAPLARVAAQHHERLDGSGYPQGLAGGAISRAGRLLGAADAYRSKAEHRPYRPALPASEVADHLRAEVRAGRLDGEAVDAVLRAAGHRVRRRRTWPAGLTPREVEVLRLVARGLSHRQIAQQLVIARKTATNHVERIYAKIDASNRAQACLFAVNHDLLDE